MRERSLDRGFVGRSEELAAFDRAVTSADGGQPTVVLVTGEPGIGKTTTLREAAARAGVGLHVGRCVEMGGDAIPLAPLADLLRQVERSFPGLLGAHADLAPLARWMGSGARDRADTGPTLFTAVLALVGHLADRSGAVAVLGFEDLHWADVATLDLVEFLARNLVDERAVLVATWRPGGRGPAEHRRRLAALPRLPGAIRIQIEGLGPDEVRARLIQLLGGPVSPQLVEEIVARGQGNPFFTEELAAAHQAGDAIPAVLSDLISADVAALDDAVRSVLSVVAAVGRETGHDLLAAVVGLDDGALERAVRGALEANLLALDRTTDAYRFRHALIGEVVYADLLPSQRTRLHGRIAAVLAEETTGTRSRADRVAELAFQLDRSGQHDDALRALLAAADAAEEIAPAVALAHLERAFELWDEVDASDRATARSHRLWQAAELAAGAAGNARAAVLARAAQELGPPPEGAARGHERLARYLWGAGDLEASRVELERAVALLPATPTIESAPAYAGLGQAELMAGHYEAAETWCVQALEAIGAPQQDPASWVMARRVQGVVHSCLGDPEGGVVVCREAWGTAPSALGRALATLYFCVTLLDAGRNEECVTVALDAADRARLTGLDTSFGGYSDALAAEGLMRLGRWSEAAALLAPHAEHDEPLPIGVLRVARAEALLAARQGDPDRARRLLAVAVEQPVDGWHQAVLDLTVAEVHLALGEWTDARLAAERGWASVPSAAVLWTARFAMLAIEAEVEEVLDAVAGQRPVDVAEVVDRLRHRSGEVSAALDARGTDRPAVDSAANLAHAGAAATRLARPDPDAWARAAERWDELGDVWWTALARLREAEAAAATGAADRAATRLREAHRVASELGAGPLVAQVEDVARRTRVSIDAPSRVVLGDTSIQQLGLTAREAEVLVLVAAGRTNRQIGTELFISEKTASVHVSNILRKLGVTTRVDAAAVAQRLGLS